MRRDAADYKIALKDCGLWFYQCSGLPLLVERFLKFTRPRHEAGRLFQ